MTVQSNPSPASRLELAAAYDRAYATHGGRAGSDMTDAPDERQAGDLDQGSTGAGKAIGRTT
jgi:hypothetical protein